MSGSKDAFGGSGGRSGGGSLKNASRVNKCPICESRENFRCSIRSDGALVLCRNVSDGAVQTKMDTTGTEYYVHIINSDVPYSRDSLDGAVGPSATPDPEPASPEIVDKAYRMLLSELTLSPEHREMLRVRGLSDDEIKLRGYRSFPFTNRIAIAKKLADRLGEANARGVPGLYVWTDEESGKSYWKLAGWRGLLIPLRNGSEQIIALKVRRDDTEERKEGDRYEKYTYVSSIAYGGPRAAQSVHIPLGVRPGATVRVTEGELKADVTTVLSGVPTLSVPGVGNYPLILPRVHKPSIDLVLVAWDADHNTKPIKKPAVALSLVALCRSLQKLGKKWAIEVWDPELGKGIDDVLSAGHSAKVRRLEGDKAEAHLVALEEKYRPKPTPAAIAAVEKTTAKEKLAESRQQIATVTSEAAAKNFREHVDVVADEIIPVATRGQGTGLARGDHPELATRALSDVRRRSPVPMVYDREAFHRYNPKTGLYEKVQRREFYVALARYSGSPVGPKEEPLFLKSSDIKGALDIASEFASRPDFFNGAMQGITFTNGFVTVENGVVKMVPHSPDQRSLNSMKYAYDPDAKCDMWKAFLDGVFANATEADRAGRKALLQEHIGACVVGMATDLAVALILTGTGNNGKSVYIKTIRGLFPKAAVKSLPPQMWSNRFHLAGLAGIRLNAVSELPNREVADSDEIKAIVAGDETEVAHKRGHPFELVPIAGHVFGCNTLPATKDQTEGFWRRFAVVVFDRKFTNADRILGLSRKLLEELPGIAAWALEGAARLQRQGEYTMPESSLAAKLAWQIDTDQVRQWLAQCTRTEIGDQTEFEAIEKSFADGNVPPDEITSTELRMKQLEECLMTRGVRTTSVYATGSETAYDSYTAWAERAKHAFLSEQKFWTRLGSLVEKTHTNCGNVYPFRLLEQPMRRADRFARPASYPISYPPRMN